MNSDSEADQQLDQVLRRALATRPISNEEIVRRSQDGSFKGARSPKKPAKQRNRQAEKR
jgi:hypothetical protein